MSMGGPLEVHGRSTGVHGRSTEGPLEVHGRTMESMGCPRGSMGGPMSMEGPRKVHGRSIGGPWSPREVHGGSRDVVGLIGHCRPFCVSFN